MVRTQIQLTEDQASRMKSAAARRGVSMAELIRRASQSFETMLGSDNYYLALVDEQQAKRTQRAPVRAPLRWTSLPCHCSDAQEMPCDIAEAVSIQPDPNPHSLPGIAGNLWGCSGSSAS